jgi:prolipoprotein diacylglyceryltransferase
VLSRAIIYRFSSYRRLEVTSFGVMVAVGALVGLWLFQRELRDPLPDSTAIPIYSGEVVAGDVVCS